MADQRSWLGLIKEVAAACQSSLAALQRSYDCHRQRPGRHGDGGRHVDPPRSLDPDRRGESERFRFDREQARRERSTLYFLFIWFQYSFSGHETTR